MFGITIIIILVLWLDKASLQSPVLIPSFFSTRERERERVKTAVRGICKVEVRVAGCNEWSREREREIRK